MPLMLTRDSIMSRMGGYRAGARGLLRSADAYARRDLRVTRSAEVSLSAFTFGVLQGRWKDKGGLDDLRKARHYLDKLIELREA